LWELVRSDLNFRTISYRLAFCFPLWFIGLDFVVIVDDNSYNVLRLPIDIRFLAVWSEEDFEDEGSSAASALDSQ
jgi:hypothetical protein